MFKIETIHFYVTQKIAFTAIVPNFQVPVLEKMKENEDDAVFSNVFFLSLVMCYFISSKSPLFNVNHIYVIYWKGVHYKLILTNFFSKKRIVEKIK